MCYYNDEHYDLYNLIKKWVKEKSISITFMTIGSDLNFNLANKLCEFKDAIIFHLQKQKN